MTECKLCLEKKILINAHIIPKSFYGINNRIFSDQPSFLKKCPNGVYDSKILCKDCDGYINENFDDFAKKILIDKRGIIKETFQNQANSQETLNLYRLKNKEGYDKLNRFFISVLWRASISSHELFSSFNLGLYECISKNIILNGSYDYRKFFSISLCWLSDLPDKIQLFSSKFTRIDGVNFYVIIIGYCKIFIKVDKRLCPLRLRSSTLSVENDLLMVEGNFKNCPEKKWIIKMSNKSQRGSRK